MHKPQLARGALDEFHPQLFRYDQNPYHLQLRALETGALLQANPGSPGRAEKSS
jgi:hypothetical protein